MNTQNKDNKIIELLNKGKSYSYIQEMLQVSPSKIAIIKKKLSNNHNSSSENSSDEIFDSSSENNSFSSEKLNNNIIYDRKNDNEESKNSKNQKNINMENQNFEIMKYKLDLQQQLELKKIELQQESFELQKNEMQYNQQIIKIENLKKEKQEKILLFRFRKLMQKVTKGNWTYLKIFEQISNIRLLREEIEEFCFLEDMEIENLKVGQIIDKTIDFFENYLKEITETHDEECIDCEDYGDCKDCDNEIDEDEAQELTTYITIDEAIQKMIDESKFVDLYD